MFRLFARIDDRLIHGQVVEAWIPYLRAEEVLVVSDEAARDRVQQDIMRLGLPENVKLEILSVEAALKNPALRGSGRASILALMPGPVEALRLLDGGARIGEINVGGLHYAAGKVQLGKAIFLNGEDAAALRSILRRGVKVIGRALPQAEEIDFAELLESFRG